MSVWLKTCDMSGELNRSNPLVSTGHKVGRGPGSASCACSKVYSCCPTTPHPREDPGPERISSPEDLPELLTMDQAFALVQGFPRLQIGCLNVFACITLNVHTTSRIKSEPQEIKGTHLTLSQPGFLKKLFPIFLKRSLFSNLCITVSVFNFNNCVYVSISKNSYKV